MPAGQLAQSMTEEHKDLFKIYCDENFPRSDCLSVIDEEYKCLSNTVRECAVADDSLVEKLAILQEVSHRFHVGFYSNSK
jgi:hypothetical protein